MSGYAQDGETHRLRFDLKDRLPDAGSLSWTLRGNDGAVIPAFDGCPILQTVPNPIVDVVVPGAANVLSKRIEGRSVLLRYRSGGNDYIAVQNYRVAPWLNILATAADVRAKVGANEYELPDGHVDLHQAYFEVEAELGAVKLADALQSGDLRTYRATGAVVIKAAINALQGLRLKVAKSEQDGTVAYERFSNVDFAALELDLRRAYADAVGEVAERETVLPVVFRLSTRPDPFTGA